ncbi:MAG: potassium transporter [Campylobacteraceae bacterium]|nr:potassium transporter [Campylobacteraceae bacterium]
MDALPLIVATLAISLIVNLFFKYLHISSVLGYIFTGFILSLILDFAHINHIQLAHIAEFGIVFLMFTIGLEFSLQHLKSMKKEVFVYGSLQVIITSAFFAYLSYYFFSIDLKSSLIIGTALSLSSTAIVLKTLNENNDIHRPYGRNATGILIFQDLAVIPILLMITLFTNENIAIEDLLIQTIYSAIFVFITIFIIGKVILTRFFSYVVNTKSDEMFISSILLIVLSASLFAHVFGFSYSLGAFLAGMLIAETKYKYKIEADLIPFRDLLLGLFFITVGLQINIAIIQEHYIVILLLTSSILLFKAILIFIILRIFTFTKRATKVALTLAQVGEFSFAVFALAQQNSLIENNIYQILVSVIIASLIFTSLAIRHVRSFTNFFLPTSSEKIPNPILSTALHDHVVVCGYSLLGQNIVKELKQKNILYVAIEHDQHHAEVGIKNGDVVFFGNAYAKNLLESVYIKNAQSVIIAIENDEQVRLICESIKALNDEIHIIVKITHEVQVNDLKELHVNDFINENVVLSKQLVQKATSCVIK